ncbi:sugar kinase [Rhizocola hellebori]|uniref:Sugar kinase n=1 Tax=Rhizocola hellebori TaxID=1392758 RepID=A0A8J3VLM7_9ACTN|nr:PfkB family carbohydrate kinase [Rhizocola hellebori]GIH10226.1 sugar kinase [Rhizocola hellebori]
MQPQEHDVLVLGGAGVDTIVYVPQLPLAYADSYMVPAIETRAGQTGDGVALGLSALGLRTVHLDVLGDDPEGDLVRALHDRHGVRLVTVPTAAGTKRAVNLVDPSGRRLSLYDVSRADDGDRLPEALLTQLARAAAHTHVSITHPCQHALETLGALETTVSVDLHNWDGLHQYQAQFAFMADVVFLSVTALADPESTIRRILDHGRAAVVVGTDGADGGYVMCRGDTEVSRYPAAALPAPAIDSNGAGDAFVSGFLFGFLAGQPIPICVRYGAIAGAHACTVAGVRLEPIDRATLMSLGLPA